LRRSTIAVGIAFAAISFAAFMQFTSPVPGGTASPRAEDVPVQNGVGRESGRQEDIKPASIAAPLGSTPIAVPKESLAMFNEYADASDLRIFVEKAKRQPARGGIYYASIALEECRALRAEIQGSPPLADAAKLAATAALAGQPTNARMHSLAVLQSRCASFTSDELGVTEQRALITWGRAQDPMAKLRAKILEGSADLQDPEKRQALMNEVLALNDPGVLELLRGLAWSVSGDQAAIFLDGQEFGGLDGEQFDTAWMLMTCTLSRRCNERGVVVEQNCGLGQICAESMQTMLRSRAASDVEFQKISAVANRLAQIVATGQVSALRPVTRK
jgi:hypothetical protein